MQDSSTAIATAAIAIGTGEGKICGNFWNVNAIAAIAQGTVCTYTTPFKVRAINCFLSILVFFATSDIKRFKIIYMKTNQCSKSRLESTLMQMRPPLIPSAVMILKQ